MNLEEINFAEVASVPLSILSLQSDIVFDGYSLQNANFITSRINYDDLTNIELNTFRYPRSDGGGVLSKYYRGRTIKLFGIIKSDTVENFNILLDEIKKSLRKTEGILEISVNGDIRQIKATVTSLEYNRNHYNITFSPIEVEFTTAESFFYSSTLQSLGIFGKTATYTEEMENAGGSDSNPTVYMVFGSGTTVSAVTFEDPTGRELTITTALTNGDVLIIDSENKIVTKNTIEIDYTGAFPIFSPGSNNFTATYTGTVLVDTTITLRKNYL